MGQAPGTADEINSFCSLNYQTTFPRFAKAKVNGKEALPLYDWLKNQAAGPLGKRIEWNCKICHRPTRPSRPTLLLQNRASCHGRLDPKIRGNQHLAERAGFLMSGFFFRLCGKVPGNKTFRPKKTVWANAQAF